VNVWYNSERHGNGTNGIIRAFHKGGQLLNLAAVLSESCYINHQTTRMMIRPEIAAPEVSARFDIRKADLNPEEEIKVRGAAGYAIGGLNVVLEYDSSHFCRVATKTRSPTYLLSRKAVHP